MAHAVQTDRSFSKALAQAIHENLPNEYFGVEELAEKMSLSRGHLYRKVKALTELSPNHLITQIRLFLGLELLRSEKFRVCEVAYKVGFSSNTYFIKCFHDHFGISPGRYKQLIKENPAQLPGMGLCPGVEQFAHEFRILSETEQRRTQGNLAGLALPSTRFFGRTKDIEMVTELLGKHRLVSILGFGGSGKTRMALQVARELQHQYKDGVWFINLSAVTQEKLVIQAFLEVTGSMDPNAQGMLRHLTSRVTGKEMLLVVDNCEHVAKECGRIIAHLMSFTLKPKFLITSRQKLHVPAECNYHIPTLPVPDTNGLQDLIRLRENPSMQLFLDRASMANPNFQLKSDNARSLTEICRHLDGIPLAIELAASRMHVLGPQQLLERLGAQFEVLSTESDVVMERHQRLNVLLAWSFDSLTGPEQALLKRLSIFSDRFDLAMVEAICTSSKEQPELLNLLSALMDKSLLVAFELNGSRVFRVLESLRYYLRDQLDAEEYTNLAKSYTGFYLEQSRQAHHERVVRDKAAQTLLLTDQANLIGALELLRSTPAQFAELAGNVAWIWFMLSDTLVASEYLYEALRTYPHRDSLRARVLFGLGIIEGWYDSTNSEQGLEKMSEAVKIFREEENEFDLALSLAHYSWMKNSYHYFDEAAALCDEGFRLPITQASKTLQVRYRLFESWGSIAREQPEEVADIVESNLRFAREHGELFDEVVAMHIYADVPLMTGRYELSERRYAQAMQMAFAMGNVAQSATEMVGVAMSLAGQSRCQKSLRLAGAAAEKYEELDARLTPLNFWDNTYERTIGAIVESMGPEESDYLLLEGRAMQFEDAIKYAADFTEG